MNKKQKAEEKQDKWDYLEMTERFMELNGFVDFILYGYFKDSKRDNGLDLKSLILYENELGKMVERLVDIEAYDPIKLKSKVGYLYNMVVELVKDLYPAGDNDGTN